jgi:glycosyltransferase involved in cell wall biosynthesis
MKILSLHARFSSFFSVCFRETVESYGVEMRLICSKPAAEAQYSDMIYLESGVRDWQFREDLGFAGIQQVIDEYQPDAILTSGWMFQEYLKACKAFRRKGGVVVAFSDTQFNGRWKQRIGGWVAPWLVRPSIDAVLVAGERQRQYARRMGFDATRVWEPLLCCNWDRFAGARMPQTERGRDFLYVGRLVESKGISELRAAYQSYRQQVDAPWNLRCLGAGPLAESMAKDEGIQVEGFVQPEDLPAQMARAGCYVLPSRHEPWGVALQEAAAVGLPLIASDAVGAAVHLIRDGWNGYICEPGNAQHLSLRMEAMHRASETQRAEMGNRSFLLSQPFKPERWAKTVVEGIRELRANGKQVKEKSFKF